MARKLIDKRLFFVLFILNIHINISQCIGITFITTAQTIRNQSYRDIRLTSFDLVSGIYEGCITDSVNAVEVTQITVNATSGNVEIIPKNATAFNIDGSSYSSATAVQGSSSPCAISGIVTTNGTQKIVNVENEELMCIGPEMVYALPTYGLASNKGILTTRLYRGRTGVQSYYNCSVPGPLDYVMDNDIEITKYGAVYGTPDIFWMYVWLDVTNDYLVKKCVGTDCNNETIIILDCSDFIMTARGDEWYGCGKTTSDWFCTGSQKLGIKTVLPSTLSSSALPAQSSYSVCQPDSDTLLLILVTQSYVIYALDVHNDFAIINQTEPASRTTFGFVGMDCLGDIILIGITNEIDVFKLDRPIIPPVTDTPINDAPFDTPVDTPVDTPSVIVGPLSEPSASPNKEISGDLTVDQRNILIGVLVGVGVPLIGAAIFLALFISKKNKEKQKRAANDPYSLMPVKGEDQIDAKLMIPYKSLTFTKEIGAGSFGKVFLGKWRGAVVAIKTNNKTDDYDAFLREARLTLKMPPHPNVVLTYGVSTDSEVPCIILEFCDGGSLDTVISNQSLTATEQRALVKGIAQGLAHLHSHHIVHRDLAARNVLLDKGIPKISDFGMSRVLKDAAQQGQTDSNIGPVRWMAPESIKDMSYSVKSDVWTFGIVISEIVNEDEPHFGENQIEVACDIRDNGRTPPLSSECDPLLKEVMQMCWKINPAERPTMDQICEFISEKF